MCYVSTATQIVVVPGEPPQVTIAPSEFAYKYNPTRRLELVGSAIASGNNTADDTGILTFWWSVTSSYAAAPTVTADNWLVYFRTAQNRSTQVQPLMMITLL
jgi:hypothetical protein